MVHGKCKNPEGRGRITTEFYINGKPQRYCLGWYDSETEETIEVCKKCKDFAMGEQILEDVKKADGVRKDG